MAKRKSKAVIMVADGAGGMAKVEDRRFEPIDWRVGFEVPKEQADSWFHYFDAECGRRGWSSSELGQHERGENSGSISVSAGVAAAQLTVVWERKRGGAIRIRAGSTRPPEFPPSEMDALFEQINDRCRVSAKDRFYRRGLLYYDGLPWRGELWLDDTVRLGPPSQQYEAASRGPRVVLVDAVVDAVGPRDAGHVFGQRIQELSAFLSVVTRQAVRTPMQSRQSWTYTIVDGTTVCDVRSLGYIESQNPIKCLSEVITTRLCPCT